MPLVCKSSDLDPGQLRLVDLHDVAVVIANVDGVFYALSDSCSKCGQSLATGKTEESAVICACGARYDLASGRLLSDSSAKRVRTYHIHRQGDELHI